MDLISCIKSVEDEFSLIWEMGLPCIFEGQAIRGQWKKHRTFWSIVIYKLGRAIKSEVNVMLRKKRVDLMLRLELAKHHVDGLVDNSLWAKTITAPPDFDPDFFKGKVESTRDPLSIFIPLPKIESTNGCARSDLSARLFLVSEFQCRL